MVSDSHGFKKGATGASHVCLFNLWKIDIFRLQFRKITWVERATWKFLKILFCMLLLSLLPIWFGSNQLFFHNLFSSWLRFIVGVLSVHLLLRLSFISDVLAISCRHYWLGCFNNTNMLTVSRQHRLGFISVVLSVIVLLHELGLLSWIIVFAGEETIISLSLFILILDLAK